MSVSPDVVRNIFGVAGSIISTGLILSPAPTFRKIIRTKSVEKYKPDPYLATLLNCMLWAFYGLPFIRPNNTLLVTLNGIGLLIEAIYIGIFFVLTSKKERRRMLLVLAIESVFMSALVLGVLLGTRTHDLRSMIVGNFYVISSTMMCAAPLKIMTKAVETKSVKRMPFFLSLMGLLNGTCWTAYALIELDMYIMIPNGLGLLFGIAHLILYLCYYKPTPKKEKND